MDKKKQMLTLLKCCVCIGGALGIVNNCMGIYFSSVSESLGVGVGSVSITVTLLALSTAFSAPILMRLIRRRIPINFLMAGGVVLVILSYLLMSIAKNVWFFYIAGTIMGIGTCCFSNLPVTLILRDWYGEKIGSVTGIAMGFGGVFGAIFNPIFSNLITKLGWNQSLRIQALIMLVVVLPCAFFLKMNPNRELLEQQQTKEISSNETRTYISNRVLYLMILIAVLFSCQSGMNSHFSALGIDMGYSLQFSATMLSAAMIANVSFKLVHGTLADATTPFLSTTLFSAIGLLGTICLFLFHSSSLMMVVGAFLYGSYFSVSTVGMSLMAQMIAKEQYGEVYSKITVFASTAYALSLSAYGMIRDFAGGYLPSLALVIGLSTLAIVMIQILKRTYREEQV